MAYTEIHKITATLNAALNYITCDKVEDISEDKVQRVVISPYSSLLALTNYPTEVYRNVKKLKDLGVRILMDDFGTGFSQIENLRQIPFDAIKIDKSFTDRIVDDEKIRSIVKFLVELIHDNDMEAIVEGVENWEHVTF